MALTAAQWLAHIRALDLPARVRIMNVCGGHERAITMAGLRGALPSQIELIPGPGCPVCICPEEDIYQAIELALQAEVTLIAFGDMLRVPINAPKAAARSLVEAQARGAAIRPIASPTEALQLAAAEPEREFVFFAAGFETTTAPVAGMVAQGIPANLSLLLMGRRTWPAVAMLLEADAAPGFDCLIAPGHVATVMGAEEWRFVADDYHIPCAVAGFTPTSLLAAIYSVLRQVKAEQPFLDNCYPQLVTAAGNATAKSRLAAVFDVADANWRGIGTIPQSGYALKPQLAASDARQRYPDYSEPERRRAGQMPPGCDCARVVLGKLYPDGCKLYGRACTPRHPVGPCMVSEEGACRIWWASGVRQPREAAA